MLVVDGNKNATLAKERIAQKVNKSLLRGFKALVAQWINLLLAAKVVQVRFPPSA